MSSASQPPSPSLQLDLPSKDGHEATRRNRRRLLRLKRKYEAVLHSYYSLGASYSEPISSLIYSLAGMMGREDNHFLWHSIVGVSSLELYGRSMTGVGIPTALDAGGSAGWGGERGELIRQVLRDEVRRLNPPDPNDTRGEVARGETSGVIPTTARSPTDTSIRLSPEPRFLLIRHWSLYESMLHSPYLASRLHLWSDTGRKRLHKLLAKMGVSLNQCKQSYTHMDMDLKKVLRQRLLKYAPLYGLGGLVPPSTNAGRGREGWGFVRSWGFKACLSATDVGVIVGAILEVGKAGAHNGPTLNGGWDGRKSEKKELVDEEGRLEGEEYVERFWNAYDALEEYVAFASLFTSRSIVLSSCLNYAYISQCRGPQVLPSPRSTSSQGNSPNRLITPCETPDPPLKGFPYGCCQRRPGRVAFHTPRCTHQTGSLGRRGDCGAGEGDWKGW